MQGVTNEGLYEHIQEAVASLRKRTGALPAVGVVPGTYLSGLANTIQVETTVSYDEIPHFPHEALQAEDGKLVFGALGGKSVVAMGARLHLFEGYSAAQVAFPVRLMHALGVKALLTSDTVNSINPSREPGEMVLIDDHINLQWDNPLIGPNDERLGPRFPDMSAPYSPRLNELAIKLAREERIPLHSGVYVAVVGSDLVTGAEYRFLQEIGADVVGMSTVPEVIAAVHQGMEVMAISVITGSCPPDGLEPADTRRVEAAAARAEPSLIRLMTRVIEEL